MILRKKIQSSLLVLGCIVRFVDSLFMRVVAVAGGIVDLPEIKATFKNKWNIDISEFGIVVNLFWFVVISFLALCFLVPQKRENPKVKHINSLIDRIDKLLSLHRKNKIKRETALIALSRLVRVESRTMVRVVFGKAEHAKFVECVEDGFKSGNKLGAITAGREFLLSLKTKADSKNP